MIDFFADWPLTSVVVIASWQWMPFAFLILLTALQSLDEETREAAGEDQEENANLKHAAPIQWVARKIGWSVHSAHLLLTCINFAIIATVIFWAARKSLPGMFRNRMGIRKRRCER